MRVSLGVALLAGCLAAGSAAAADEPCLACHAQKDVQAMATRPGRDLFIDPARHAASVHAPLGCVACHTTIKDFPHPKRVPKPDCAACHAGAPAEVASGVHRALGATACARCHGNVHTTQRAATISPQHCATCHEQAVHQYRASVHREAQRHGDVEAATCQSCHGPTHRMLPARDPQAPTAKAHLPATCGHCHANPDFLARHQIAFARPVEAYRLSVHGRAVEAGNRAAPSCSDCHSNHLVLPARDARSKINHWQVARTCGACHAEIARVFEASVHGRAAQRGVRGAPVCTDCHGEHTILAPSEPQSLVNPARVSSVTCGRCHADERLAQRYNLPTDKVPAFQDSYHGLAARAGSQTVANCASCHGVHNILPSADPRSTVHPANLARTCGSCHPGAGERFSIGPVHVLPATASEHAVVRWIRVAYLIIIFFSVAFMLLHNLLDFAAKLVRGGARIRTGEAVPRMNAHFRVAHGLVALSFPILVVTGFALKFPESWWAHPLLHWETQFAVRGTIHRVAGVVLLAALVYHAVHLIASRRDRVILRHLRPGIEDVQQFYAMLRYNLGRTPERPSFGKFSYAEKFEYLAFVWGSVVMALSGFLLWFNNFTLRYFPKWVSDAATAVHYYEAILATLAILIWHFYMTIFDPDVYPMDLAWLTGKTAADHLRHTRPAYYALLAATLREKDTAEPTAAPSQETPEGPAPQPPSESARDDPAQRQQSRAD